MVLATASAGCTVTHTAGEPRMGQGKLYVSDNPTYDEFWQSKAIQAERIQVPTFLIGGWRDSADAVYGGRCWRLVDLCIVGYRRVEE